MPSNADYIMGGFQQLGQLGGSITERRQQLTDRDTLRQQQLQEQNQQVRPEVTDYINQLMGLMQNGQIDPKTAAVYGKLAQQGNPPPLPGTSAPPPAGPPGQQAWQGVPYQMPGPPPQNQGIGGYQPSLGVEPQEGFSIYGGGLSGMNQTYQPSPHDRPVHQQGQGQMPGAQQAGFITRGPATYNNTVSGPGGLPQLPANLTMREFGMVEPMARQAMSQMGQTTRTGMRGQVDPQALKDKLELANARHKDRMEEIAAQSFAAMQRAAASNNTKLATTWANVYARAEAAKQANEARMTSSSISAYDRPEFVDQTILKQAQEEGELLKNVQEALNMQPTGTTVSPAAKNESKPTPPKPSQQKARTFILTKTLGNGKTQTIEVPEAAVAGKVAEGWTNHGEWTE